MRFYVIVGITLSILACSTIKVPVVQEIPVSQYPVTEAFADSCWLLRADSVNAGRALAAYKVLAGKDSTSIQLWSKLAHAYYYYAQFLTIGDSLKDKLFMRGYEASQTILSQDSKYRDLLFSTGDENIAVRGLDLAFIDALYWGLANYGQWLSTKGPLVRLGQRDLLWATLEHIHDLDSNYYYGAYYRLKGPFLARDPATQNDTLAIREAFESAINLAPDYLGNYTLMAMFYCPLTKDKDLFYSLLTQVVTAQLDRELPYYPENLFEKGLAERIMVRAEEGNWF